MKSEDIKLWQKKISQREAWMKTKRAEWDKLYERYNLDLHVAGMDDEHVIKVSRFYPLIRKLIASVAYNYPRIFVHMDEGPLLDNNVNAEDTLERAGNRAMRITKMKREVHQCMFEALFTFRSYLKIGYNPPGADAVAPYVASDDMQEDFPFIEWVSAKNILVDPLVKPHNFYTAQDVIERQFVPLEFVKKDPRFAKFKNQLKGIGSNSAGGFDESISDIYQRQDLDNGYDDSDDKDHLNAARDLTEMVLLYEIHDRVHRRRIVFANDIEEPIEDIPAPLLRHKPIKQTDPFTGEEVVVASEPTNNYLIEGGFPYYTLSYDLSDKFYGQPMMAYEESVEQIIVNSLSRRQDLLKRYKRIVLGNIKEQESNPQLPDKLDNADDGTVLWVRDPHGALVPMDFGAAPADQVNLERDARSYEAEIIQVDAPSGNSATESAIRASGTEINREWMQVPVANAYRWGVTNMFNMFSDVRFLPDKFNVNVSRSGEPALTEIMEDWWFEGRWEVEIDPGSMLVLNESLERNDTLQLYDRLINLPFPTDKREIVKLLGSAFRKVNFDKFLQSEISPDAAGLAQMENSSYLVRGGEIPPRQGQNHQIHMEVHLSMEQVPEFTQLSPEQQQLAIQTRDAHNQQHQQLIDQEGGGAGRQSRPSESSKATDLVSVTRANAQNTANAVQAEVQANA
tara:strand:- start:4163 stop:6205 length:2043 start_codon:yes stop_codon:yes gene_type:complete